MASASSSFAAQPLTHGRLGLTLRAGQHHTQPVLAHRGGRGGKWARRREGKWARRRRDEVALIIPGQPAPLKLYHVNQEDLNKVLIALKAVGCRTADGAVA
jgi:hypothetical protein